ncbi:MAG: hypothetical protein JNL26_08585 [Gemmatimonadetes bacterium]|nr:hypothetical protein [Gemmatimonadota bacterium]
MSLATLIASLIMQTHAPVPHSATRHGTATRYWRRTGTRGLLAIALVTTGGVHAQAPNIRVQVPGVPGVVLLDSIARAFAVAAPAQRVEAAIHETFAGFGIKPDAVEPGAGRLPSRRLTISRRLANTPLSRYIDCGRGFSGENANVYRVTIVLAAWPDPQAGDARSLHVAFIGGGLDPAGSRSNYVLCTSKGVLEEEFATKVQARLATSP